MQNNNKILLDKNAEMWYNGKFGPVACKNHTPTARALLNFYRYFRIKNAVARFVDFLTSTRHLLYTT